MTVTVAVVSYNTRALLLRCLRSLAADAEAGRADVWVLDNGSNDGSLEAARAEAPWARVLDAGANIGFGRAINHVADRTDGGWLLAANADIALEPGALEALVRTGESGPRVGCVAPRLILPDGTTQHSVHPFPTLPLTLAFNLGVMKLAPAAADRLCLEGAWNPERPRDVPWAIGACLLLRRAAFDAVGRFDERQWIYAEDVDLCWRLADAGWTVRYEPVARVHHESSAATSAAFGETRVERFVSETYEMLLRRKGRARTALTAAVNVAGAAARVGLAAAVGRRTARRQNAVWLRAHLRGVRRMRGKRGSSTLARSG